MYEKHLEIIEGSAFASASKATDPHEIARHFTSFKVVSELRTWVTREVTAISEQLTVVKGLDNAR